MEYTNKYLSRNMGLNVTQSPTTDASFANGDFYNPIADPTLDDDVSLNFKSNGVWFTIDASKAFA